MENRKEYRVLSFALDQWFKPQDGEDKINEVADQGYFIAYQFMVDGRWTIVFERNHENEWPGRTGNPW